jgi:hypothetical protein
MASSVTAWSCVKLAATGNTDSAIQCAPINVTFTAEITSCSAQPRYKNFTVSRTGWELAALKNCYWTSGTVNSNDRPHSYRNFTWQLVECVILMLNSLIINKRQTQPTQTQLPAQWT